MSWVLSSGDDFDVDKLEYELKVTGSLTFQWEVNITHLRTTIPAMSR